jgi:hypothetical protein
MVVALVVSAFEAYGLVTYMAALPAFGVSDFKGLRAASDQIVADLKHQYRLGYDPPDGPSHFRRIQVRSTRKGVVVRTRSGYMPPS